MMGDLASRPLAMPDGSFLLPIEISPAGEDGKLLNPGGGYTWHESAVLHARWNGQKLEWEMSDVLRGDPERSTRGVCEPTIARLAKNRLMMVMRGSNDRKPELTSVRWVSYSDDGGWTWTRPAPWTYSDGSPLLSPSSCSQLLEHSSGRLFWLGNLSSANPRGNRPRYPFWIGEVDRGPGLLIRGRTTILDDLAPGEDPVLSLSNFYAREDRQTREICIHMTRLFALEKAWRGDADVDRVRGITLTPHHRHHRRGLGRRIDGTDRRDRHVRRGRNARGALYAPTN